MLSAIALAVAALTPADWFVERALTVGACERFYAIDQASAEAKFEREIEVFSDAAKAKLRHARDEGRTLTFTGQQCVVIMELQTRPSYVAKYGIEQ